MIRVFIFIFIITLAGPSLFAQSEKAWIRQQIKTLSGDRFSGRGYVGKGADKAAQYVARQFEEMQLYAFSEKEAYIQTYRFPVNTFPGEMHLKLNKKILVPGVDYIIQEASSGVSIKNKKVKTVSLAEVRDSVGWQKVKAQFNPQYAYLLKDYDTLVSYLKLNRRTLAKQLRGGVFLLPKKGKMIWSVARDTIATTLFTVEDSVLPKRVKKMEAYVQNKYIPDYLHKNAIGYVPGTEKEDSFIVFTAHLDHLGMMGRSTMFPGAHDNASGTSLMLYLASYFAQHPPKYSVAFMGFSGEEAGLMGSKYYTEHPFFPLSKIAVVVNLDMTGDATDGITMVNGKEQKEVFEKFNTINHQKNYLPKINQREQTANSDHYSFSEKGVPAVFIYGLGAKGYYHDVFDKAAELSLNNIDNLARLLIDFVQTYD